MEGSQGGVGLSLSIAELDFWIPVIAFGGIALFALSQRAPFVALMATLAVLAAFVEIPWSETAGILGVVLGFWLEYFTGRWRRGTTGVD